MKANYYLSTPSIFSNREKIYPYQIKIINIQNNIIEFIVKQKHISKIWFNNGIISPSSDIKFDCTCDSFKYQFSQILAAKNSSLTLIKPSNKMPKKQPIHYICKHLEGCLKSIIHYKNILNIK